MKCFTGGKVLHNRQLNRRKYCVCHCECMCACVRSSNIVAACLQICDCNVRLNGLVLFLFPSWVMTRLLAGGQGTLANRRPLVLTLSLFLPSLPPPPYISPFLLTISSDPWVWFHYSYHLHSPSHPLTSHQAILIFWTSFPSTPLPSPPLRRHENLGARKLNPW
jgi:hypothetical protein